MLILSKKFREKWRVRVGSEPCIDSVILAMREGVRVQRGKPCYTPGGKFDKTLSIYLHNGIVYTVDEIREVVVSVFK